MKNGATDSGTNSSLAIVETLQRIGEVPESFPVWPGARQASPAIRKATVERFPYLIAFEQHKDYALVLGVAGCSRPSAGRRPGKVTSRRSVSNF